MDTERLTHGLKTAFACLVGFILMRVFHPYIDQWLLITIIVVMCAQLSVGSMIQKSYMRFLGTVLGSSIAALTLLIFGFNELVFAIVITLSVLVFSFIATGEKSFSESGTLGAATVVIILINPHPTLMVALTRFLEISLGILLAALVSQFVLPMHASKHLRETQAKTLRKLRIFYLSVSHAEETKEEGDEYLKLDESIALTLIKQRKLATDSSRELFVEAFNRLRFQNILQIEKEILRCIAAMHHIYELSAFTKQLFTSEDMQKDFHMHIAGLLENMATFIERSKEVPVTTMPNIEILKAFVYSKEDTCSREDRVYLDAFLFAAESLIAQLESLLKLMRVE